MTKPELVTYIMEATTGFTKTHLMDKHKDELEAIYAQLNGTDATASEYEAPASAPVEAHESQIATADAKQGASETPSGKRQKKDPSEINDNEKLLLSTIPQLPDFESTDSEMNGRAFVKKAEEVHGIPLNKARALFASLRAKGYYNTKGKESGQTRTTFRLSEIGVQYLKDNGFLTEMHSKAAG